MVIYSYKMKVDTGFAPCPFHGSLTLANCKAGMRLKREVGEWIAGFTSKTLANHRVGKERLIYLALISEKLSFKDYWNDERFLKKRENVQNLKKPGDQIYKPNDKGGFIILDNPFHSRGSCCKEDDLSGKFVLVCKEFYYFGNKAIDIGRRKIHIPKRQARYGNRTEGKSADRFIEYIRDNYRRGIIGRPHQVESGGSCG